MPNEAALVEAVLPLVACHLAPIQLYQARASDAAVRRLANRVERIDRLVRVAHADTSGRPPLVVERFDAGEWLLERAREMSIERQAPQALVMGRHLIQLGMEPSPGFNSILKECFDRQIEGEFSTVSEGLMCAREILDRNKATEDT